MTAFLIASIVLFFISLLSNIVYVLNNYTELKGGSVIGIVVFSGMIAWALSLLF
jgi:hypothetical protein